MNSTMSRFFLPFLALGLTIAQSAFGAGRTVAVLEHRAGISAPLRLPAAMASSLEQLTSYAVISPSEARRRFGAALDGKVGRCMGAPRCIAEIGAKIPCDEVIMVGLSQLGHVIVAIQRIDVQSGKVLAQLADSFQETTQIESSTIVGYLHRLYPPAAFKRYGQIVVRTAHLDDQVYLDGALQGQTPLQPLKVAAPRRYTVTVKRAGYLPFVARLDVLPDAAVEVTPTLVPRGSPAPLRWYQQWWVWAIVGGVVAGTAATVAAITITRAPDTVPAIVNTPP